jgi:hypothetical protein
MFIKAEITVPNQCVELCARLSADAQHVIGVELIVGCAIDWQLLGTALSACPALKQFSVELKNHYKIEDASFLKLFLDRLETLALITAFDPGRAVQLIPIFKQHASRLLSLNLNSNKLSSHFISQLGAMFGSESNLVRLDLSMNNLKPEHCESLAVFLQGHPGLAWLNVSDNPLQKKGLILLAQAIKDHPGLVTFLASKIAMSQEDSIQVSNILSHNRLLSTVKVSSGDCSLQLPSLQKNNLMFSKAINAFRDNHKQALTPQQGYLLKQHYYAGDQSMSDITTLITGQYDLLTCLFSSKKGTKVLPRALARVVCDFLSIEEQSSLLFMSLAGLSSTNQTQSVTDSVQKNFKFKKSWKSLFCCGI